MAGTITGGKAAAQTNKELYGEDFYQRIGGLNVASWVRNGRKPRGFAWMKLNGYADKVSAAGRKGGTISRRTKKEQ